MASIFEVFFGKKESSASKAHNRLSILIAQDRAGGQVPNYLPTLQKELLEVLSKYVAIDARDIRISKENQNGVDVLALNITLPENATQAQGT